MNRREFLERSGALVVSFNLVSCGVSFNLVSCGVSSDSEPEELPGSLRDNPHLDGWIRIEASGDVTVYTGKAELGQGIQTALVQIAADELDLSPERVHIITADTALTPNEGYTSGSNSIQRSGTAIRYAAAETRQILLELAAAKLGVAPDTLRIDNGLIVGQPGSLGFGEVVSERTLMRRATGRAAPKAPSEHRYVGTSLPRLDIPGKVFGEPSYVHDLRLDGMLHARVARPPSYTATLLALDEDPVRALPGVMGLVRDGSFVAVVAAREDQAVAALETLRDALEWDVQETLPDRAELARFLRTQPTRDDTLRDTGDPPRVSARSVDADYFKPYIAHASIGPACAVAKQSDGELTVWTHGQGVFPLRAALSKVLAVPETQIRAIHMDGAGCYGHNGADDAALDAALVARAFPGRPVRVQWSREDEHGWEPFGSAMSIRARGGLDDAGHIAHWSYELWSTPHSTRPGRRGATLLAGWHLASPEPPPTARNIPQPSGGADRNAVPLYRLPDARIVEHLVPDMPVRVSALRALGGFANTFAIESFMDELAALAGRDPLAFRLDHLDDARARAVLEAAARRADWEWPAPRRADRGRGLAVSQYKNLASYIAVVADVSVARELGTIRVEHVAAAVDAGQIINPDGVRNQIEGGIVQATSWTLKEEVTFSRARITSRDWSSYPILSFSEAPTVDVEIIDRPELPPVGVGETAQGPTAAAIANAVFDAVGTRLRTLPFTPDNVKWSLG